MIHVSEILTAHGLLITLIMEAAKPLKYQQTSARLQGATTLKTAIFILAAV
jgi:hypothetical protein